jgi:uncharacterized protein YbjT (DUF2867 family)
MQMRVAVIGATGRIGRRVAGALRAGGHTAVPVSRGQGVDVVTGQGLAEALTDVDSVIDVLNIAARADDATVERFRTATANLLAAEVAAGVRHHVLLSIVNVDRIPGSAHYAGKRAQEQLVEQGPVPATIVRATQFHDFPLMVASWTRQGATVTLPPLLLQPVAPADVAAVLVEVATGAPQHSRLDLAGPQPQDLVDMARRSFAVLGEQVHIIPTWHGPMGLDMSGDALLAGPGARLAPTTFDEWLTSGGPAEG